MNYVVHFDERTFNYVNDLLLSIHNGELATYEIVDNYNARKSMTRAKAEVEWHRSHPHDYESKSEFFANEFFIPVTDHATEEEGTIS